MQARLLSHTDINPEAWDHLIKGSPQGSALMQYGFINALLPGGWQAITAESANGYEAVMPLNISRKFGLKAALQPILSRYWGIAFAGISHKSTHAGFSWKKKIVSAMIKEIPNGLAAFDYYFHPAFDYPLPFYWARYTLHTRYTYRMDVAGIPEKDILRRYTDSLKNSIRSAEKNGIRIEKGLTSAPLEEILKQNAKAGKYAMKPEDFEKWNRIAAFGVETGQVFSLTAYNSENIVVAGSLYITDGKCTYALGHNVLYSHANTNALPLLVHHAIAEAAAAGRDFDFLGSMMEPVEAFNRRFGARPLPYLSISRKNKILQMRRK